MGCIYRHKGRPTWWVKYRDRASGEFRYESSCSHDRAQAEALLRQREPAPPPRIGRYTPHRTRLCLDHDHATDIIRGLLCRSCNTGTLKEHLLRAKLDYIETAATPYLLHALNDRERRAVRRLLYKLQNGQCAVCGVAAD